MSIKMRKRVERIICRRFILDAIAAGCQVAVNNGEEETTPSASLADILAAMFATDEEHLILYREGKRIGWAFMVYGNSGHDVISDYSVSIEPIISGALRLADKYED